MAVSRAMRRLLAVLETQEEQSRASLEAAVAELRRLEGVLQASTQRDRQGRLLVTTSVGTGEFVDRLAGLEETLAAHRDAAALKPKIVEAERRVTSRRNEFLGKRIERRQAETLIEKTEAGDKIEAGRRAQRDVDGWFLGHAQQARNVKEKL
jgi:flagellar export protein FliJ